MKHQLATFSGLVDRTEFRFAIERVDQTDETFVVLRGNGSRVCPVQTGSGAAIRGEWIIAGRQALERFVNTYGERAVKDVLQQAA